MLIHGTEMHVVTFVFAALEVVMFFYQLIFYISRKEDKARLWYLILLFLLIQYNIFGGLFPDPQYPISIFIQNCISYGTGFLMAAYFPFYFYKAFQLKGMKFHAYRGVFIYILAPYIIFVSLYCYTRDLNYAAKWGMTIPIMYSFLLFYSITKSVIQKYKETNAKREDIHEIIGLYVSYTAWIVIPIVTFYQANQVVEYIFSNTGFFIMTILFVKKTIKQQRDEYQRLQELNQRLSQKVQERTKQLELINEQKTNTFVNIAHEIKTPLTLINSYLEEYISNYSETEEITIVKSHIDKISRDITNYFDLERFNKGIKIYNHYQATNFSNILIDQIKLFKSFSRAKGILLKEYIEDNIFIKADPDALISIINNLIENAIKYSPEGGTIEVRLRNHLNKIHLAVKDNGCGIAPDQQKNIFEPYFHINNKKKTFQGMGLGLSIVKKIVDSLDGEIHINSNPQLFIGTEIILIFDYISLENSNLEITDYKLNDKVRYNFESYLPDEFIYDETKKTLLIVEDHISMIHFLRKKLSLHYNVYTSLNGADALKTLRGIATLDLIVSDVMMPIMDGFEFAKCLSENKQYNHIPIIFLTAKSTNKDRVQGLKSKAIDYISKPFLISELELKIEVILDMINKQRKALLEIALINANKLLSNPSQDRNEIRLEKFEDKCKIYNLTIREIEVVKLANQGHTYKTIGESLHISEKTVKTHIQNIFDKLKVTSKIELINKLYS